MPQTTSIGFDLKNNQIIIGSECDKGWKTRTCLDYSDLKLSF